MRQLVDFNVYISSRNFVWFWLASVIHLHFHQYLYTPTTTPYTYTCIVRIRSAYSEWVDDNFIFGILVNGKESPMSLLSLVSVQWRDSWFHYCTRRNGCWLIDSDQFNDKIIIGHNNSITEVNVSHQLSMRNQQLLLTLCVLYKCTENKLRSKWNSSCFGKIFFVYFEYSVVSVRTFLLG